MAWSPSDKTAKISLLDGDRYLSLSVGDGSGSVRSAMGHATGKRYFEFHFYSFGTQYVGLSSATHSLAWYPGQDAQSWALQGITLAGAGQSIAHHNAASFFYADRLNDGYSHIRVAVDFDNKKIWYSTRGTWPGDPTDPANGSPAHDFSGVTDPLFITFYGTRSGSATPSGYGNFLAADMYYPIPAGYHAWGESGDGDADFIEAIPGVVTVTGQPASQQGAVAASGATYLDHARAGPFLIINGRRSDGAYYAPPLIVARSVPAQSALLWRLVTGGKWYIEYGPTVGATITYAYDNLRVGLARSTLDLNAMIGDGDEYAFTFGGWNEQAYLIHHRARRSAARSNSAGLGAIEPKGIAMDLTDARNGKLWYHNGGQWGQGNPVSGTSPDLSGISGAWFVAVSARNGFEMAFETTPTYRPDGFENLLGSAYTTVTNLWGNTDILLSSISTLTHTPTDLVLSIGNNLLRSTTWNKRSSYYLGLVTSLSPVVEVSAAGYARQPLSVGDAHWTANFQNVSAFTFPLFDATVTGWALYADATGPALVFSRPLAAPVVCSASGPAFDVPANQFTWSFP